MNVDLARLRAWGIRVLDIVPGVRLALDDLIRVEFIDRMVVVAAQSLFAMVPLFVVIAAFSPEVVRDSVLTQVADVMAIQGSALDAVETVMSSEQIRTQTGLIGVAIVLLSATSYARALQRMYERTWKRPHRPAERLHLAHGRDLLAVDSLPTTLILHLCPARLNTVLPSSHIMHRIPAPA